MSILFIPDTHAPYHHPDTIKFLEEMKRKYKPTLVVHTGDIIDSHSIARWDKDPDTLGAVEEFDAATDFCTMLGSIFPSLLVCFGNHDLRFLKKIKGIGVPSMFIRELSDVLGTPSGWKWNSHFLIKDLKGMIYVTHGDGFSGKSAASNAAETHRMNTVIGHIHAYAAVYYSKSTTSQIWGMNVGCLIDEAALAFAYGSLYKHKPILGCGVVVDGVPHFEPL